MYRAASGALVFGAGTVQWAWGLDSQHDRDTVAPSTAMQQATMNLFADMGAQPGSRQSDLSAAGASTDHTAPGSAIGSAPSSFSKNQTVTVSGTASDALGGRVAAVEVSTDGGTTWHPASGRETWTYTGQADGSGPVKSRAVDDSGNLEGGPGTFYPGPVGPDKGNTPGTGGSGTGSGSGGKGGNGSGSGSGAKPGSGVPLTVGPTHVRMSRKGVVTLKVSCGAAEQRCGKVKLRLQTHGGSTVASTKRSMAKSHTLKFALQLSRSGRRKLVKAHSLVLRAVATTSDQAGNSKTTRTLIRVRAPRGK
jgi:hypothetical protein